MEDADVKFRLRHNIGIDKSRLFAVRAGVWGVNDIVWVGEAANMAAKLTSISDDQYPIYITKKVFDALSPSLLRSKDGAKMWQSVNELKFDRQVYKSSWYWTF